MNEIVSMVEKTKEKSAEKVHFIFRAILVTQRNKRVVQLQDMRKVRTRMENDKCVEYKNVAIELLKAYLESEQAVISEYSGNFKRSALELKKQALGFLERLDEGEDTFNELVKDMWISDYYGAESEGTE